MYMDLGKLTCIKNTTKHYSLKITICYEVEMLKMYGVWESNGAILFQGSFK